MLGQSWMEDPRRFLSWRLARLCIDECTEYGGITIRRVSHQMYATHLRTFRGKNAAKLAADYVLSLVEAPRTRQLPLWGAA